MATGGGLWGAGTPPFLHPQGGARLLPGIPLQVGGWPGRFRGQGGGQTPGRRRGRGRVGVQGRTRPGTPPMSTTCCGG